MKVALAFVPPGGGETDYSLDFEIPALPNIGDYMTVVRPPDLGTSDFIVRRIHWGLQSDPYNPTATAHRVGTCTGITIECEFALSPYSSDSHKSCVDIYDARGKGRLEFDVSVY